MISIVPMPAALGSTVSALQTCFWAALRSRTSAPRRQWSEGETLIEIPVRITHCRMTHRQRESPVRRSDSIVSFYTLDAGTNDRESGNRFTFEIGAYPPEQ